MGKSLLPAEPGGKGGRVMTDFLKLDIPEEDLHEEFLCSAAGPGGQHVNRSATAVRLIFDAEKSAVLNERARKRLYALAGTRAADGCITIFVRDTRSLAVNRDLARARLAELIARALAEPKKRKKTKPTRASGERRLKSKSIRAQVKKMRAKHCDGD